MTAPPVIHETAARLWAEDTASRHIGMRLVSAGAGRAEVRMQVSATMVNGHGICHGGYLFALADSAFACAANEGAEWVVSSHCSITYLRPVRLGEWLVADAVERQRQGRSGLYDVTVTGADGAAVAEFRVLSRALAPRG